MSIITLTTDFGLKDHFVGALKGAILSNCSDAVIIDISHQVDLFNIREAWYVVNSVFENFPKGTIHVILVDAVISENNPPIVIFWRGHYFVSCDNGILSLLTQNEAPETIVEVKVDSKNIGCQVFANIACLIAKGIALENIGSLKEGLKEVKSLQPHILEQNSGIKGNVIYIDYFGNAVTDISTEMIQSVGNGRAYELTYKQYKQSIIHSSYSEASGKVLVGDRFAVINEQGFLEIAIYKGNPFTSGAASTLLGFEYGDAVFIKFI